MALGQRSKRTTERFSEAEVCVSNDRRFPSSVSAADPVGLLGSDVDQEGCRTLRFLVAVCDCSSVLQGTAA